MEAPTDNEQVRPGKTYSLQLIFALSVMILLTILTTASAKIILAREKGFLEQEAERRILAQCRSLASLSAAPLLDEFPEFVLTPLIKDILSENPEMAYAYIVDPNGTIRGASDLQDVDTPYKEYPGLVEANTLIQKSRGERFRTNGEVVEVSVPVLYQDGSTVGRAYLGMRNDYIKKVIREASMSTVQVLAGILVIGLVVTYFLVSNIVRPINKLTVGSEEIARGNLDYKIRVKSRTEVGRLAWQFNRMTERIKEAQKNLVEQERLDKEIEIARQIEERLLPKKNLALPGYDVTGFHQSAMQVGGDYYDLIPLDDENVGLTVADVSGKGIPGLVVMAMTSALLRTHGPRYSSPSETLIELNRMLCPNMRRGTFITMFYGILHLPTGKLTFAGAGHNPLVHFSARSGLQSLMRTTGPPLGVYAGKTFDDKILNQALILEPGDGFVQYTDGVNEATNSEMEEFGIDSLLEIVRADYEQTSERIVSSVVEGIREFSRGMAQSDDITLLALKRLAVRNGAASGLSSTGQVLSPGDR